MSYRRLCDGSGKRAGPLDLYVRSRTRKVAAEARARVNEQDPLRQELEEYEDDVLDKRKPNQVLQRQV